MQYIKLFEEFKEPIRLSDLNYLHELGIIDDLEYYDSFLDSWKYGKFDESDLLEGVTQICNKYEIDDWKLVDGRVNVTSSVKLSDEKLSRLPLLFGRVGGDFECSDNRLTTLEGAPNEVVGDFGCSHNQLTSLDGAPDEVGGDFNCSDNQLTTLDGAPDEVGGFFECSNNRLTTLEGAPNEVGGFFGCSNNDLTTLEGAPKKVGWGSGSGGNGFNCRDNDQLTTLDGIGEVKGTVFSDIK